MVIPYKKDIFRLYGQSGYPLLDMMTLSDESEPLPGVTLRCMHPFGDKKRVNVTPSRVERLLNLIWDGTNGIVRKTPTLSETRDFTIAQLGNMREDHVRSLNPTPYKMSVSADLYAKMHQLWEKNAPPMELS
jgi:nicotinate phosphoribosyltransferase